MCVHRSLVRGETSSLPLVRGGLGRGFKDLCKRSIHGNPKAAKMRSSFFYEFSNYGSYDQLTDDGLTQWHPAFLQLGNSLEDCAQKYRGFCKRYNPKSKPARKCHWGNKFLAGLDFKRGKGSREEGRSQQNRTEKSANST